MDSTGGTGMTRDMTPAAVACRADIVDRDYTMADLDFAGDEREVAIFYRRVECELEFTDYPTAYGEEAELIAVQIGEDTVLTRDEARAMFGDKRVRAWEERESERLWEER
jgi:hypothetical protein